MNMDAVKLATFSSFVLCSLFFLEKRTAKTLKKITAKKIRKKKLQKD